MYVPPLTLWDESDVLILNPLEVTSIAQAEFTLSAPDDCASKMA
jgi:hypothetical protein